MKFFKIFLTIFFIKSSISVPITNFSKPTIFFPSLRSIFLIKPEAIKVENAEETTPIPIDEETIWDKVVKDFGKLASGAADLANDFKEFSAVVMRKWKKQCQKSLVENLYTIKFLKIQKSNLKI